MVFSFVGLIGTIVIFRQNRNDAFVRANARAALNMQITWLLFSAILFAFYLAIFLGRGVATQVRDVGSSALLYSSGFWIALGTLGIILLSMLVVIVMNVFGAIAANAGRVYRYPIAYPFLREKVGASKP